MRVAAAKYYTFQEAAKKLKLHTEDLLAYIEEGKLSAICAFPYWLDIWFDYCEEGLIADTEEGLIVVVPNYTFVPRNFNEKFTVKPYHATCILDEGSIDASHMIPPPEDGLYPVKVHKPITVDNLYIQGNEIKLLHELRTT